MNYFIMSHEFWMIYLYLKIINSFKWNMIMILKLIITFKHFMIDVYKNLKDIKNYIVFNECGKLLIYDNHMVRLTFTWYTNI
jgi:hypothetical protein